MKRFFFSLLSLSCLVGIQPVYAACTPGSTAGDDTVNCTGAVNSFQYFYGGSDHVTLQNVTGNGTYWLDESTHGNPTTDGEDKFYAIDSHFSWVFGFGEDDYFEINNSSFSNLYADTNPYWVNQRGDDTIIMRASTSNGWILGGNDNDIIKIHDSNVSQVASGYSDIYGFDYTPHDGNDTVLLDHVNFTEANYYYTTLPGAIGAGKGDDHIEMIHGGEAFNVAGGYGNDVIIVRDNEHFNACNYFDESNVARVCGIYGDVEYSIEQNISHDNAYMSTHHGDDIITIEKADMRGITVNGGHGSDILTVYAPVMLAGTILDGGDDRSVADTFIDRVQFEQWKGDLNGSQFHNWEQVRLHDHSSITFQDANISVGADPGLDPSSGLPYGLIIDDGSALNLYHDFVVDGNLHDNAILNLQDNNPAGTLLEITGDYTAFYGKIYMDTVLNGSFPGTSDVIHIHGNATGETQLFIQNIGGNGAQTTEKGILLVEIDGNSNAQFTLDSEPLIAGDYLYTLYKADDGNWYLQSEKKHPELSLTKTVDIAEISQPTVLHYHIEVRNTGNVSLGHITLRDVQPDGSAGQPVYVSGDDNANNELDVGETWIYRESYTVTQEEIDQGKVLTNTLYVHTNGHTVEAQTVARTEVKCWCEDIVVDHADLKNILWLFPLSLWLLFGIVSRRASET